MDKNKTKSPFGYIAALALLLCIAFPVISTGTAFSRYSKEIKGTQGFEIQEPEKIILGTVSVGAFSPAEEFSWKTENGKATLEFAVANGTSKEDCCKSKQKINVWMIASLGLLIDEENPSISLVLPSTEEGAEPKLVPATAVPIEKNSDLYGIHGEGWVLRFFDESGNEIFWELEGGKLSFAEIKIEADTSKVSEQSLLIPQITAEITAE